MNHPHPTDVKIHIGIKQPDLLETVDICTCFVRQRNVHTRNRLDESQAAVSVLSVGRGAADDERRREGGGHHRARVGVRTQGRRGKVSLCQKLAAPHVTGRETFRSLTFKQEPRVEHRYSREESGIRPRASCSHHGVVLCV